MKVRVPVLVKDPDVARWKDVPLFENFVIENEDVFLDGPIGRRVAVLDFDPQSGQLNPGARFVPPAGTDGVGSYAIAMGSALEDPTFVQTAVFGGVHKTLAMFEESDALGRRIRWAFDGPQLLVVPRAGDWANAFYERESRSLQFFFFTPPGRQAPVYTAHSQDIIAHETTHAIIDGVVPDIYDAATPQSLALHESIADFSTLLMSFRSRKLATRILEQMGGSIAHSSAFTGVAEQFGMALDQSRHALRELNNDKSLADPGLDRSEPHDLSEVLSGAIYRVMVQMYDEIRANAPTPASAPPALATSSEVEQWKQSDDPSAQMPQAGGAAAEPSAGKALFVASERLKRTVIRGLDYLPPGEITFADYGRAVVASDKASHPDSAGQRDALVAEFVKRRIADNSAALDVRTNYDDPLLHDVDLTSLLESDWYAYQFAERGRRLLGIPKDVPFEVRPRLDVTKSYYHHGEGRQELRELLFKVSWSALEPCKVGGGLPRTKRVVHGTTLAIDWDQKIVRAVLSTDPSQSAVDDRDAFIARLLDDDLLTITQGGEAPAMRHSVSAAVIDGALRVRSTARALHVLSERRR